MTDTVDDIIKRYTEELPRLKEDLAALQPKSKAEQLEMGIEALEYITKRIGQGWSIQFRKSDSWYIVRFGISGKPFKDPDLLTAMHAAVGYYCHAEGIITTEEYEKHKWSNDEKPTSTPGTDEGSGD